MTRDTDRGATVGNTIGEGANVAGFVPSGQPQFVVLTIDGNVLEMPVGELLDGSFDSLHASGLTHGLCRVVGVATSTVPVTSKRLRVEGDLDTPLFGDADEQETGHPEVVTHGDTLARADLELPLRGHDLGVDTGNVDTSVHAGAVVGLDQITSKDLAGTYRSEKAGGTEKVRINAATNEFQEIKEARVSERKAAPFHNANYFGGGKGIEPGKNYVPTPQ